MVVTTDSRRYVSTADWIENMGNPLLTFVEPTADGEEMERRVLFEGVLDVDFAIFPKKKIDQIKQLVQNEVPPQIAGQIMDVFGRGMRVIVDKDGIAAQLQAFISSLETPSPRPPSQHKFLEVVNDFFYHAVFIAKHLRRGELWWAGTCLNCYMQRLMLRIMEWHAKAVHGWNHDIWFRVRFLEEWAHPQALKELPDTFARYDRDNIKRTLLSAMNLFRQIATETAEKLSYRYPIKADEHVTKWIKTCLSEKT